MGTTDVYQCKLSNGNHGPIFSKEADKPGSIRVRKSNACITMPYTGIIPTVTRVDFDKERMIEHLTKWENGIFRNDMLYSYYVECQKI